ncbi:DUF6077 domain-containing protein [Micromonospora radicis]|uniref:DUF6077 domain-containing protein n=1 Tax=Micromonospora radicis TaxID=1894971 RepID=UPI0018F429AF|nr:DUF6077 domain-containing protein [Micromonospora radicis]
MTDQSVAAPAPVAAPADSAPAPVAAPTGSAPLRTTEPTTRGTAVRRIRTVLGALRAGFAAIPAVLTDCAVLAFALWTLLYHAALPLGLAPSLTLRIWLVAGTVLAVLAVLVRLGLRWRRLARRRAAAPGPATDAPADPDAGSALDPDRQPTAADPQPDQDGSDQDGSDQRGSDPSAPDSTVTAAEPSAGSAADATTDPAVDRAAAAQATADRAVASATADRAVASATADRPAAPNTVGRPAEQGAADRPTEQGAAVEAAADRAVRMSAAQRWWTALVLLVGTGAAIAAGVAGTPAGAGLSWWVPASAGLVAAVGAVLLTWRTWRSTPATWPPAPATTAWQSAYALLIAAVAAVASLYLARSTPDDIYYVGRSVWVAERDIVPLNDFLFSENVLPAMASQPPIASVEVFAGALARLLGIPGASAVWYVLLPAFAVLAVLALWRLVQRWAPRRPVLAFTVAVAFLALVCGPDAALGTFHLPRLYQGKGMFVSAVVPLMWLYLTRWFDDRSKRGLVLIVALSITAIGLTTTAAIILPLLVGGAALMMLLVGRWKSALAAGVAALTYPVGMVVVTQLVLGTSANEAAADVNFYDAAHTYRRTFEIGIVGVIGGLGLWCGALLARRRTPALLAAGGALTLSVLLVPGVLEWVGSVTGISVVLWRVSWLLALPALIGLLCTVWLPTRFKVVRGLVGVVLAAGIVTSFTNYAIPMWDERSGVLVHEEPTWKIRPERQAIAQFVIDLDRPDGLVLAPASIMRTIPLMTTQARVVLPRDFFLVEYDINSQFSQDRLLLMRFANGGPAAERPDRDEVGAALERLDVGTICVYSQNRFAQRTGQRFGYTLVAERPADPPVHPNAVTCLVRE